MKKLRYTPAFIVAHVARRIALRENVELPELFDSLLRLGPIALADAYHRYRTESMPEIGLNDIYMEYGLDPDERRHMERQIAELMCEDFPREEIYDHLIGTSSIRPLTQYPWHEILFMFIEIGADAPQVPWKAR